MVGGYLAHRRKAFRAVPNPAGRVAALKFSSNATLADSLVGANWSKSASGLSTDPFMVSYTPAGCSPALYIAANSGGFIRSSSFDLSDIRIAFWLFISMSSTGSGTFLNIGGEVSLRHRYSTTYPNGKLDLMVSGASTITLDIGTNYYGYLQVKLTSSNVYVYLGTTELFNGPRPAPVASGAITVQAGSLENFFIDELEVYVGANTDIKPAPTAPIS